MGVDVVQLAKEIVAIRSVSRWSNAEVCALLEGTLKDSGFEVEHLEFVDVNGERKVSLVAKKGRGTDGLAFFSHSDTVPGDGWERDPFDPTVEADRLVGLGACDMKGPLAATIAAGAEVDVDRLSRPVLIVITADEEITGLGARQVVDDSALFNACRPKYGVIAEPTRLIPVYAHKGSGRVIVTAHGRAAHTSTDQGVSANFRIAPFLAKVAELADLFRTDTSYMNNMFVPPTNGFNMVLSDGDCKPNVTAAQTVCTLSFRPMPDDRSEDVVEMVSALARQYDFDVSAFIHAPFYISPDSEIVRAGIEATGLAGAETVAFGTDAAVLKDYLPLVVLGPGNIAQAHTAGEWIGLEQLSRAVEIYGRMITALCG